MIHSSIQPIALRDAYAQTLPTLFSNVTIEVLNSRLSAMKDQVGERHRTGASFRVQDEHSSNRKLLSVPTSAHGTLTNLAWRDIASHSKGNVVEVLRNGTRAAFGTVVGDGVIVSKASELGDSTQCRIPDGEIVEAETIAIFESYDVVFLRVKSDQLRPVGWTDAAPRSYGQLLVTPDHAGKPLAWGIVSAAEYYRRTLQRPTEKIQRAAGQLDDPVAHQRHTDDWASVPRVDFPVAFEHDAPLKVDQYGGPLIDLHGDAVGITIARVGDYGCIAIPAAVTKSLRSPSKAKE